MSHYQDLIQQLSKDVKPVVPIKSNRQREILLWVIALTVTSIGFAYWSIKKEEYNIPSGRTLIEMILLWIAAFVSGHLAIQSTSPHTATAKISIRSWLVLTLWSLLLVGSFISFYSSNPVDAMEAAKYNTWLCPTVTISIAFPLVFILFFYLRRGAILFPRSTALYLSQTSFIFGVIGLGFICPWADPLHEILWHVLPVILLIGVFSLLFVFAFRHLENKTRHSGF